MKNDGYFGPMFDLNGDGKIDSSETAAELLYLESIEKELDGEKQDNDFSRSADLWEDTPEDESDDSLLYSFRTHPISTPDTGKKPTLPTVGRLRPAPSAAAETAGARKNAAEELEKQRAALRELTAKFVLLGLPFCYLVLRVLFLLIETVRLGAPSLICTTALLFLVTAGISGAYTWGAAYVLGKVRESIRKEERALRRKYVAKRRP